MRIFMVGFMGSGKTHIGRKLAEILGYRFVDMDERIEAIEKCTVAKLFTDYGELYFRKLEHSHLLEIIGDDHIVVSTGGGAPCFFGNMDIMNSHGITVYLDTPIELLFGRLKHQLSKRPLLANKSEPEVKQFIADKISERLPYYSKAKIILHQPENGDATLHQLLAMLK